MTERSPAKRWSVLLLGATLASLMLTIVAGYVTRLSLADSTAWVTHTDEVKLAVTDCQRALDHRDPLALENAELTVGRLTVDNPRQQQAIARAESLTDGGRLEPLEELFASMRGEEDRLMTERLARTAHARATSSAVFAVGAVLTLAFGAGAFVLLRAQRQALARQSVLLAAILESVDEGIIALEPPSTIIALNAVARSMWSGAAPADQWPTDWRSVLRATYEDGSEMPPEDGPLARALRGETSDDVIYRVERAQVPAGEAAGVWVCASARPIRDPDGRTIAAVTTLRDMTAENARAQKLRDQSSTDELTGLLNRRGFMAVAKARIAEARRTKAPIAVLYADVNGLKRINDELGHEQGDRVIEDAAAVLRRVFRGGDVVARIGGDEFVALLPHLAPNARDALLDRLASAIRAHEQEGRPFRLSMSYATTFMDWERAGTLDELLAEADRRMYARKRERANLSAPVLQAVPGSRRS